MYTTYCLLFVTIAVSVYAFNRPALKARLLFNPYLITHHRQWYRSFTHAFVHADGVHLGFNMYVLYSFGVEMADSSRFAQLSLEPELIHRYGGKGYLYFSCLYVGGILFSTVLSLRRNSDTPSYNSLGASGAVMAVVFAYILIHPTAQLGLFFIPVPIPAYLFGPLLLGVEYVMSKRGGTGIAHDAHFAGAVFGWLFMGMLDGQLILRFFSEIIRQ